MAEIYPAGDAQYSANLGLSLWGADEVVVENFLLIDSAFGSVGGSVNINGTTVPNPNFINSATVTFGVVGSNISLTAAGGGGGGTVTSVSFTGGLISVANPTTTPALTVAGTSGGIPYFSSASTWATSGVLPAGDFVLGGGAGASPTASFSVVPVANGGTGTGSTLTGLVRGGSPFTAAEISGDATTSGSNALTLATVNGNVGSFTYASITVNAKGLITAASNGTAPGTVTSFSAGALSPLFTTSVATSTTTPALTFSLSNATGGTVFGNNTGSSGAPAYTATPVLGVNASVAGTLGLATSTASGATITMQNLGALTAYNFNLPITVGSAGQVLTSQGGGSTSMTWSTPGGTAWSAITNAAANLTLANAGFTTTFNQTSGVAWLWANTTTGTSGTTNASPLLELAAQYYTGSTTGTDLWTIGSSLAAGTNGASNITFAHTGSSGTAIVLVPSLTSTNDSLIHTLTVGLGSGSISTNSVVGYQALYSNTSGAHNVAIGYQALNSNTTSGGNVAIGYQTLYSNTGTNNVAIGYQALNSNTANYNVALGYQALNSNTANYNVALGSQTLYNNGVGAGNVALGFSALYTNSSGSYNVALGYLALNDNISGAGNVAIGYQTLYSNTAGYNVAIGYQALNSNTSGASNVALGYLAGYTATPANANVSGSNNTWIGFNSGPGTSTQLSNASALGYQALNTASNQISLGNSSVTSLLIASVAGITQSAEAVGTIATTCGIVTTFTAVSDERLKNSTEYEGGLAEILPIKPIRYRWNEKGQELSGQKGDRDYIGFSANNVQKSIPESIQGYKGEERYLSFDDRPVIAALVNAVKELAARVKELEGK